MTFRSDVDKCAEECAAEVDWVAQVTPPVPVFTVRHDAPNQNYGEVKAAIEAALDALEDAS